MKKFYLWGLGLFFATMTLEIVNYIVVTNKGVEVPKIWITNIAA